MAAPAPTRRRTPAETVRAVVAGRAALQIGNALGWMSHRGVLAEKIEKAIREVEIKHQIHRETP